MGHKGRWKIRFMALFANLSGCQAHSRAMWGEVATVGKVLGSEIFRAYMIKGPRAFPIEEARGLKPLLVQACKRWQGLRIESGQWTHEGVYAIRETLMRYILHLTEVIHTPTAPLAEGCPLDPGNWTRRYETLVQETQGRAGFQLAPPHTASLESARPGDIMIPSKAEAKERLALGATAGPISTLAVRAGVEDLSGGNACEPSHKLRKLDEGGDPWRVPTSKEAPEEARRKVAGQKPTIHTDPGGPQVHFLAFPRSLFSIEWTLKHARDYRWPPTAGIRPGAFETMDRKVASAMCGYWREAKTCRLHPKATQHNCWDKRLVGELAKAMGKHIPTTPKKEDGKERKEKAYSLKGLKALDDDMLREWLRQAEWASRVWAMVERFPQLTPESERKFQEAYKEAHRVYWPPSTRITGLPPVDTEGLEEYRTAVPQLEIEGKLEETLRQDMMRDYPHNTFIPREIANWLSAKVDKFRGINPENLYCVYRAGKPDLAATRDMVWGHRVRILTQVLDRCIDGGVIRIPEDLSKTFTDEFPSLEFYANTVEGVNQIVTQKLCLGGIDGKLRMGEVVLGIDVVWARARAATTPEWSKFYNATDAEGKILVM